MNSEAFDEELLKDLRKKTEKLETALRHTRSFSLSLVKKKKKREKKDESPKK